MLYKAEEQALKQFVSELKSSAKPQKRHEKATIAHKSHQLTVSTPGLSVQSVGEIRHINYRPPRGQLRSASGLKPKLRVDTETPGLNVVGEALHEETEKDPSFRPSQRTGSSFLDAKRWEVAETSQDSGFYSSEIGETGRHSPAPKPNSWYSVAVNPVVVSKAPKDASMAVSHTGLELEVDSHSLSGRTEGERPVRTAARQRTEASLVKTGKAVTMPFRSVLKGRKVVETLQPGVRFYMQPEAGRRPNHFLAERAGKAGHFSQSFL